MIESAAVMPPPTFGPPRFRRSEAPAAASPAGPPVINPPASLKSEPNRLTSSFLAPVPLRVTSHDQRFAEQRASERQPRHRHHDDCGCHEWPDAREEARRHLSCRPIRVRDLHTDRSAHRLERRAARLCEWCALSPRRQGTESCEISQGVATVSNCNAWGASYRSPLAPPHPPPQGWGQRGRRVNSGSPAAELTRGNRSSARFSCPLPRGTALSDGSPPYDYRCPFVVTRPHSVAKSAVLTIVASTKHCSAPKSR